ncbi:hypothetical protein ACQKIW_26465 [Bacillus thuringiensis]|uniref:hypothetical protein n=1 Tax=Bacillus thuringiensis TaxID=1428 RepID=UPI003CFC47C4
MNRKMSNLFPGSAVRNTDNKTEQNNNIDNNVNINNNNNKNIDANIRAKKNKQKVTEEIHGLLKENNDKKVVGFYLDKDIREAFKTVLGKNPPRGLQSKLANKIFRDFFKENDIL